MLWRFSEFFKISQENIQKFEIIWVFFKYNKDTIFLGESLKTSWKFSKNIKNSQNKKITNYLGIHENNLLKKFEIIHNTYLETSINQ